MSRRPRMPARLRPEFAVRARRWCEARLANPRAPLIMLAFVCVAGSGVRAYRLTTPVAKPPNQGYIFDERYYVSAARVIAGERVTPGDIYYHAGPSGADPNAEHPQLGKVIIAGSIDIFGDNAIGWRISAVLFGAAAILLMYWLVRCAGGSPWLALGAASLASFDNLWLVHSRIAVLDIYVVPFMLAGVAFYLRRRPVIAGLLIGVGCCVKEFAAYAAFVVVLLELMRVLAGVSGRPTPDAPRVSGGPIPDAPGVSERPVADAPHVINDPTPGAPGVANDPAPDPPTCAHPSRPRWSVAVRGLLRAGTVCLVAAITYFTLLSGLDTAFTPYSGGHAVDRHQAAVCRYLLIWRDGCNHFAFMNHYASELTDHGAPKGIATTPTAWWINRKVIDYYATSQIVKSGGVVRSNTKILWFRGEISRVLLFTSWLALLLCVWWAIRRRDDLSFLTVAWALGTWLPPELFHLLDARTTYLYYMVVTMPALYLAVARLLGARRVPWLVVCIWVAAFLWDFANLYPFRHVISL